MDFIKALANKFCDTFYTQTWSGDLAPSVFDLSIAEAYQVQDLVTTMRVDKGEMVVGFKVGCTSQAIRIQFGLQEPISARLFSPYIYDEGVRLNWQNFRNCAIEPEMVLKIGQDLKGKALSDEQLIAAIDYVSPGIELHQFKFWFSPASSQELICSGGIHAGLVIGRHKISPQRLSFASEIFRVFKDDQFVTQAPASEIMGGPLHSLRWLVKSLSQRGTYLKRGSLVIPGSPVELVEINQDTCLKIEIDGLGSLTTEFKQA